MLNLKSLFKQIVSNGIFKTGCQMTGQLLLSFKNFVACGIYNYTTSTTLADLFNIFRYSSGIIGECRISTAYGVIPSGLKKYLYLTHRSGGINGAGSGDNHNWGNLFLFDNYRIYGSKYHNANVSTDYTKEINTIYYTPTATHPRKIDNSNYSLNTNSSWEYTIEGAHIHVVTLYVDCVTVGTSTNQIGKLTYGPVNYLQVELTNSAGTVIRCTIQPGGYIYAQGGRNGHGFKGTFSYISS